MPRNDTPRRTLIGILVLVGFVMSGSQSTTVNAQSSMQVIASGLDNPRGLAFGPDGALYVAEAGRGGTSSLCLPLPDGPGTRCYGPSGAITRILAIGDHRRVVVGLPSLAGSTGAQATGPQDIDFGLGSAWVTVGLAANPASRAALEAAGVRMGRLVKIQPNGQWNDVLDISAYEGAANPDGTTVDSNPFGLRIMSDHALVADAGANALLRIGATGTISTLAVFPRRAVGAIMIDSVPTSVVTGPDGNLYVGEGVLARVE